MDRISKLLKDGKITPAEAKRRREQRQVALSQTKPVLKSSTAPRRVKLNAFAPNIIGMKYPTVTTSSDVVTVSFSEIIKVLHTSNGERIRGTDFLHPSSLPYIVASYGMYGRFRIKRAYVSYQPLTTANDCGTIAISACHRAKGFGQFSMVDVINNPNSASGPASLGLDIPLDLREFADDWFPVDYSPDLATAPPGAPRYMYWFQSPKTTMEAPVQSPVGVVRLSYVIQLTAPNMPPSGIHDPDDDSDAASESVAPDLTELEHTVRDADAASVAVITAALAARGFTISGGSP